MGKELLRNKNFLASIRELDRTLQALPAEQTPNNWSIEQSILNGNETSGVQKAIRSQTLCTALQIALVDLLSSWNVKPAAVVGHSSGEIAAAYAAGLMSSSQAILVAYLRGYIVDQLETTGSMMAVGLDVRAAQDLIQENDLDQSVCVACVNAPESVTLSGSVDGILLLETQLQKQHKFCRVLRTDGLAYHSHMMKEAGEAYETMLQLVFKDMDAAPRQKTAQMYSSVGHYGDTLRTPDIGTDWAKYWRENLEKPVQFESALRSATASGDFQIIEIGPHTTLKGPVNQVWASMKRDADRVRYAPSLIRDQDADLCMKELAGTLFMHGHALNWQHVNAISTSNQRPLHSIPPYPWDYENTKLLYHESRSSYELRNRKHVRHELLGSLQPTGNGIDWSWRNDRLRLKEVPWMRDHRVGGQIVFPAAGYLAMIMEGYNQILDEKGEQPRPAALATISPRKISTTSVSSSWYDFSISSWKTGKAMLHCVGSVRKTNDVATTSNKSIAIEQANGLERVPTDRWYEKFASEGLDFGKNFHSVPFIEIDGSKKRHEAVGITRLIPHPTDGQGTYYPMHPITIDACLQAGIMSTCAGVVSKLQGYLPVFIKECLIRTSSGLDSEAKIYVRSNRTGVSTQRIHCTLRDSTGAKMIEMADVRMSLYVGKIANDASGTGGDMDAQRHPCLRVRWKPDIQRLQPGCRSPLREYIASFLERQDPDLTDDESIAVTGALLDLAGHKKPQMRVLEVGESCNCKTKRWSRFLDKDTSFGRYRSWHTANIAADGTLSLDGGSEGPFDTIVVTGLGNSEKFWKTCPASIISSLADGGVIVTRKTAAAQSALGATDLWVAEVDSKTLFCRRDTKADSLVGKAVVIVVRDTETTAVIDFASFLLGKLQQVGMTKVQIIPICDISKVTRLADAVCISLVEMEQPYLATMDQTDLDLLRRITNVATQLLWVTGAGMLNGREPNPDLTLSSGLSRALMLEQPSLRFVIMDVGSEAFKSSTKEQTCNNIMAALTHEGETDDKEYVQLHGILYVSRFGPESDLNSLFQRRLQPKDHIEKCTLGKAKPARLSIGKVGVTDTIHFQQLREPRTSPPAGFVDVEVQVMSINAKDVYALNGRVETQKGTIAMEFGGVVTAKGPDVPDTQLKIGDRVVAVTPNHFITTVRVPAWAAQQIQPDEDLTTMAGLPIAYSTALYALHDRARLREGESVLIHSGTGALGIATIAIAQRMGAIVYTTVSSPAKKAWIVDNLGVPSSNIFHSREAANFVVGVKEATQGRGVDVVINSLTGDLMHASWDCIAEFGRFVEVGKRELVDAGKLDMAVFLRNATFTAFDLSELFFHKEKYYRDLLMSKMREVLELFRIGAIKPMPTKSFDVADISNAYRYFSKRDRIGKVVISLENQESSILVSPAPYLTILNPDKVYLLVGCLGGLGRSLSRWLLARGVRNFVFLGRSGCDKLSAQTLVAQLQDGGANVTVVRGDVCNDHDVAQAVKCCIDTGRPIGGIVQASMGLSESLFSRMSADAWQKAVRPKWAGTWNLHSAIRGVGNDLDFFLLLSSISGTVGTATESNYCAANGFLDAFARKCRLEGMPTVSLGLGMVSEVGYLHENPEIEALLLRRGIQPLTEEEFLQMVDFALLSAKDSGENSLPSSSLSHLLTGLEPLRLRQLKSQGFDVSHNTAHDPRASILSAALEADEEHDDKSAEEIQATATAPWLKSVPSNALTTLKQQADAPSLEVAVLRLSKKCFCNLILLAADQIDERKPLNEYGVDSMIASEFRSWFWNAFRVDVPFLDILSQGKSLQALSTFIADKLVQS
ncbi:KR domain-containing protein [Hypoxylon sp. FL0890]|nr:KR domain-containing protein [Hypoxylon sp. FL0890]